MEEIGACIAAIVAELLVDPIRRQISYAFKYQRNMEELKKQVKMLTNRRESVQNDVDEAKRQGEEIKKEVQDWLDRVDEFVKKVVKSIIDDQLKVLKLTHERESVQHSVDKAKKQGDEIEKQVQEWLNSAVVKPITDDSVKAKKLCSIGFCPNLMTLYPLSKKAVKATKDGVDLWSQGSFQKVSHRLPPRRANSLYIKGYEDFPSRMSLSERIMEALEDTDTDLIGVYGMGGVGKTTLVKKVAQQAKEKKLFDVVVTAVVTETPDIRKIQGQIADELGLTFQEETELGRAARLRVKMKKDNRILVILDNVWAKLDLESIGIPVGGDEKGSVTQKVHQKEGENANKKQCKILLTSRRLDVLRDDMDIQKNFKVEVLSDPEAESLFWKIVGRSEEKSDLNPIAVEIVGKCGGLLVAIKTIANALKNKNLPSWKTARDQLKNANPQNIRGMNADVYSTIKLSFNFLEGEEAKSLFLLCSLCNDGHGVNITDMLKYSMGLGLFQDVATIEEGRDKLLSLIDDLKTSCLLMDHDYVSNCVKMHDVIHVVAVSIASTTKLWFNLQDDDAGLKEELEKKLPKDSTAVSLQNAGIYVLPEKMEFPKLELLLLDLEDASLQIPDAVFEGMKGLKVLDMSGIHLLSPPTSLRCLINLHTLCLDRCRLEDVAIIGELKELEVLSFLKSDIEQLPREIGQLTRLRLLDLSYCSELKVIKPNVISSLTCLEELYMVDSFDQWDIEGQSNASIAELKQLSCLTALDIHVPNAEIIPQDLSFGKLKRYRIFIGEEVWDWSDENETSRTLKLKLSSSISLSYEIKSLLNRTEDVHLYKLKGVKSVVYELSGEGFPQLKHLHVHDGSDIQYIANSFGWGLCNIFPQLESMFLDNLINLEKICHHQLAPNSFSKLRIMKVRKCDRLKHLFSFSMVNNLSQLQEIEVTNCKELEEIISKESMELVHQNESTRRIEFTQLHTLTLECLPRLTSFSFNASTPDIGSQEIVAEDEADGFMSLFSQNVVLPSLKNLKLSSINIRCTWPDQLPVISFCCQALTNFTLEECNHLKFLFSYSMVQSLVQLQKLEIQNCKSIETIINTEELSGKEKAIKMVFPKLLNLQLKGLPKLSRFSSGTQISIEDCPNLKTFFSSSKYADIKQSKEIEEMNCHDDIYPLFDEKVVLPTLASINLSSIRIQTIWHNQLQPMSPCFQNLKEIIMDGCDTVKHGFPTSMVESLVQLEVLEISNCKLMEVVTITAGERTSNTLFTKLHRLHLKHLPELTTFCNFAGKLIELTSLAHLCLGNCPKMHAFVSNSPRADMPAAKEEQMNSEKNLQYSHIQPFFDEKVQIPDLKFLRIEKMDNMRKIWHHQFIPDSFSKIDSFMVSNCHNLLNVFPSNMLGRLQKLAVLGVSDCESVEVIFEELNTTEEDVETVPRFVFPQLTCLQLLDLPSLRSFYPRLYISEWPKLNKLRMWRCNKVEILTSEYSSFEKSHGESQPENSIQEQLFIVDKVAFPKIEQLTLEWHWIVKEILHRNFLKYSCNLKVVGLIKASKQSGICPCCFLSTLTNLERLDVYIGIFEEIFTCGGLDCKEKHVGTPSKLTQLKLFDLADSLHQWEEDSLPCKVFRNLTSLKVLKCDNLKNLVPSFVTFQNLKKLKVSQCDGFVNLMEVSVAKSLVQLVRLKISECKMIEEIIMHGVDEEENRMIFNRLEYLELHSLPKLTSFCSWNCSIEFPSLQQMVVRQCPTMEIFSQGDLSTPKLQRLQTAEVDDEGSWEGSLNMTIQKLFKDMVGFRDIENFTVSNFPHLKEVWREKIIVSNLKSLVVDDNCCCLRYVFTSSAALGLVQLKTLEIKNCAIFEVIVAIEEETVTNNLFPNLNELKLINLQELGSFCNFAGNAIELPSLTTLWIVNCPNMQTFISNYTDVDMSTSKDNCHADIQPLFDEKIRLSNLKFLQLHKMDKLREIWHHQLSSNSFSKLDSLCLHDCHNVLNVFPSNMFGILQKLKGLLCIKSCSSLYEIFELQASSCGKTQAITATQLEKLVLHDLPKLKHIWDVDSQGLLTCQNLISIEVIEEETVTNNLFPNLYEVELINLPELKSFCNFAGNAIELPSLTHLWIENCPKMQTFISNFTGEDMSTTKDKCLADIQPLFDEKIRLSNLKFLRLHKMDKLREIWHHQLSSNSFSKLDSLCLHDCHNVLNVFPSNMFGILQKLKGLLCIKSCSSLYEIFELQASSCGKTQAITATQLEKLVLHDLPKLKHIWDVDSQGLLTCQNLISIEVRGCGSLKSIFPASVGRNLVQLEELWIEKCCMVEEIFAKEKQVDEAVPRFPRLTFLRLAELPRLRSFYPRVHISEWPMLKKLQVWKCDKVEVSASNFLSFQVNQGESQQEKPMEQPLLLLDKVPFNNLESLTLDWKWIEKESLHEKLPVYSCKLSRLAFVGFHNEANICVSCFLHKLHNLERLQVQQGFFKEIFSFKGFGCEEKHVEAPSKLSSLLLFDLFDSLHLWEENSLSGKVFQNLTILEVIICGNLKCLVPSSASFKNLTTLEVFKCNGLLNLVAAPTAKSMMQLTKLSISKCERIEEIIIHEGDEVEDIIIFKKLSYLELQCLPSLTSFYSGNYITEFPSLEQLVVRECPNMKTFSLGVLRAPRLYGLQITETAEGKGYWNGNLNTTMEHLFTENGQSSKED